MLILTNIFFDGLNISEKQKTKANLQQQANYVLVVWKEHHEDGNPYEIIVSADQTNITFNLYDKNTPGTIIKTQVIEYPNNLFTLHMDADTVPISNTTINSKSKKVIPIEILIKNENDIYQIKTTLSRL